MVRVSGATDGCIWSAPFQHKGWVQTLENNATSFPLLCPYLDRGGGRGEKRFDAAQVYGAAPLPGVEFLKLLPPAFVQTRAIAGAHQRPVLRSDRRVIDQHAKQPGPHRRSNLRQRLSTLPRLNYQPDNHKSQYTHLGGYHKAG